MSQDGEIVARVRSFPPRHGGILRWGRDTWTLMKLPKHVERKARESGSFPLAEESMVVQAGPAARAGQSPIGRRKRPWRGRGEELRQTVFCGASWLLVVPHSFPRTAESRADRLSELAPLLEVVNEARDVCQPVPDSLP
jgi:hypothetical protein